MYDQGYAYESSSAGTGKWSTGGGQVPREIDRQNAATAELHGVISTLEERLGPVRLAKPEAAASERDQPEPLRADVAQHIANGTASVEQASRRLQSLLNELEL